MEVLLIPVSFVLWVFAQVLRSTHQNDETRRFSQPWCAAAQKAGLTDVADGRASANLILTGRLGPHNVHLSRRRVPDMGLPCVRLVVQGHPGITLRAEDKVGGLERLTGSREIEIGDVAFDREVYVHGTPERLRAVLDVETRRVLRSFLEGRFHAPSVPAGAIRTSASIRDGDIVVDFGESETYQLRTNFSVVLPALREVADRLALPESVATRIIENTRREPEWQVRLENVRLLVSQFPQHPSTPEALQRACEDEDQEVKLEAALGLGPEKAEATLREIACGARSAALAARAIVALDHRMTREQLEALLSQALRTRRHETALVCLDALGKAGGPSVVEPLARVLALHTGLHTGDLAAAAARALGAAKAEAAEAPLLAALQGSPNNVRLAAAQALGKVGRAGAVLPLREIANQGRQDAALRKAARESIAQIQSRLGGASPGQLSMSEGQGGELSPADQDPHGRVSITEDS